MYDRIVIAVDGSDEARRAAKRGLELARAVEAEVTVVSVLERKTLRLTETAEEKRQLRERGEEALAEIETLAAEVGHAVRTELLEGKPAAKIREHVATTDAELLVVGRQGRTGLGRRLLGGVTEQLLHRSDVPVLVVPDGDHDGEAVSDWSDILITTDGSENAEMAVPHGIGVAERCASTVHVLNVVDLQAAGGVFDAGGLDRAFIERLETRGEEAVDRVASDIEESTPALSVETAVERTTSFDGAAAGVEAYVEANGIDLVVLGSHGRSNLKRQLLGSVASTVLRTVDVPVLVVTRPD